jgi:glycosyl-4,4'-diaponeurosporenoate acyltransferase
MALPTWLKPLVATAAVWVLWSLLVGTLANHLPDRVLQPHSPPQRRQGPRPPGWRLDGSGLGIRIWKRWIPDAGSALPGGVRKASLVRRDPSALKRLVLETRRAELVHWALWPAWIPAALWLPPLGVLINLIFATLFNLPCLLLQRYNRRRLEATLLRMAGRGRA